MSFNFTESSRRVTNCVAFSPGVHPTFLCSACLCIFAGDPARFENKDDTSGSWRSTIFSHHDTLGAFQTAAKDGCYICSRLDALLRDEFEDALHSTICEDEFKWDSPASTYEISLGTLMERGWYDAELCFHVNFSNCRSGGDYIEFLSFSSNDYEISQELPPTTGSLQSVRKGRSWLEACVRSDDTYSKDSEGHPISSDSQELGERYHALCAYYSTLEDVPTRLLDIRSMFSGTWRICVPSEDSTGAW